MKTGANKNIDLTVLGKVGPHQARTVSFVADRVFQPTSLLVAPGKGKNLTIVELSMNGAPVILDPPLPYTVLGSDGHVFDVSWSKCVDPTRPVHNHGYLTVKNDTEVEISFSGRIVGSVDPFLGLGQIPAPQSF